MSESLQEDHTASHSLVSQIMNRAQIFARIARDANDHVAVLLLVFFLVDHKRDEDDGEENGTEKETDKSEVGEASQRGQEKGKHRESCFPADEKGLRGPPCRPRRRPQ